MGVKVLTGVLFAAGFIGLCLFGPPWLIYAVLQLAAVAALWEFCRMAFAGTPPVEAWVGCLAGTALPALAFLAPEHFPLGAILAPVPVLGSAVLCPRPIESAARRVGLSLAAVFYVGLLFAAVVLVGARSAGADSGRLLLLLGAAVLLGDVGAYFAGTVAGRHKLAPAVSPGKTVEGAVGAVLGSLAGTTLAKLVVLHDLAWTDVFAVALPSSILGQVGDLAESLFKRSFGVKDSGALLPGHGGILDRFDGVLFAAPYLLAYHVLFGPVVG